VIERFVNANTPARGWLDLDGSIHDIARPADRRVSFSFS
jgi:hypothetical protein